MKSLYVFLVILVSLSGFAQKQRVEASLDTTRNKIGAQFNLTLRANVDTLSRVTFPKAANFGALEVIRDYQVDTVKKDERYELVKRYGLAQFDSGKYVIPSLQVIINKKPFATQEFKVEVADVVVDTLKQKMYDIKPIVEVKSTRMSDFLRYLLIGLLILGIGALIYWLVKKFQIKKAEEAAFKTPIERATSLLQTLEKKELWQKGEVKSYYSELTDIARNYIEEVIHIPAMESTTSELILALRNAAQKKRMALSKDVFFNLEKVLKQADLVKFAKSQPLANEIADDREKIGSAIVTLDRAVPQEVTEDEVLYHELQHQKLLKRQKRNRIMYASATVLVMLLATMGYFIATKGFIYVKDTILGHPTKELVEGEWIKSEYGDPAIIIETPRVLRRIDTQKALPKETIALLKEFQTFAYGSILDNFYITISTNTYKGETEVDLSKGIEGMIQALELQGAQNMLVKQEEFETREGISGKKAYGSFSMINPKSKKTTRLYYEALLFGQKNGLQQILIIHDESDRYAPEIRERILNSVELKTTKQ